jgi:hypothetical protein
MIESMLESFKFWYWLITVCTALVSLKLTTPDQSNSWYRTAGLLTGALIVGVAWPIYWVYRVLSFVERLLRN